MDRTHVLQSSEGRDGDGPSRRQNGQAVGEPSVNPFLENRPKVVENLEAVGICINK